MVVVSGGREQANRRDGRSARDPRCGGPTALLREPDDIVIAGLNGIDAMAEVTARPRRLAIESSSRHDATQREAYAGISRGARARGSTLRERHPPPYGIVRGLAEWAACRLRR